MIILYRVSIKLVLLSMLLLLGFVGYETGLCLDDYREVKNVFQGAKGQIDALEVEIAELNEEKELLASDLTFYEQLAREEFGMVKEDEVVYIVPLQ